MKFSKATDYALHTMLYLIAASGDRAIGVQQLAEQQKVPTAYLSKILNKLVKAGLIESTPGANGGYRLKKHKADVSFLDIIRAIEGNASLFDCSYDHGSECLIQREMLEAERRMEVYLQDRKLLDIAKKFNMVK